MLHLPILPLPVLLALAVAQPRTSRPLRQPRPVLQPLHLSLLAKLQLHAVAIAVPTTEEQPPPPLSHLQPLAVGVQVAQSTTTHARPVLRLAVPKPQPQSKPQPQPIPCASLTLPLCQSTTAQGRQSAKLLTVHHPTAQTALPSIRTGCSPPPPSRLTLAVSISFSISISISPTTS